MGGISASRGILSIKPPMRVSLVLRRLCETGLAAERRLWIRYIKRAKKADIMGVDRWVHCGACQRTSIAGPDNRCSLCGQTGQLSDVPPSAPSVKSVNLSGMNVPPTIIEMVPESVARENVLMPIGEENGMLQIVMSNPYDLETITKLQFILARDIQLALAPEEQIVVAINRHYGQS
jgi:type II secretion system (T2SS) protein E